MQPIQQDRSLTTNGIRDALRVCFDPELAVNIVDLGLLQDLCIEPDPAAPGLDPRCHVHLVLLQRTDDEQRSAMLRSQVENRLMGMREISQVTIETDTSTPWTVDRLSGAARRQLGLDRSANPALVQIRL